MDQAHPRNIPVLSVDWANYNIALKQFSRKPLLQVSYMIGSVNISGSENGIPLWRKHAFT